MKTAVSAVALLAMIVSTLGVGLAQNSGPQTSLSISLPQETVKAGSDVRVDVVVKNVSNHDIGVGQAVGNVEREYDITVLDESGSPVPETERGRKFHSKHKYEGTINSVVLGTLKPGQTLKEQLFVNRVYDLSHPGKYSIQVMQLDPATNVPVKSNRVMLTVTS